MDATPPPELADHERRIILLENAVTNLACELRTLQSHLDARFIEQKAYFEAQLHDAIEKLNDKLIARMDAQHHQVIALQVAIFLALIALVASS